MSANTKTSQNPWTFDVRVRERNLKSGSLTEKDLEKHLASLPDLESTTEPFGTHQPALEAPEDLDDDEDDLDDEEDEDEDDEVDEVEEPAAVAAAPVAAAPVEEHAPPAAVAEAPVAEEPPPSEEEPA